MKKLHFKKWNIAFVGITFCACIAVIIYASSKIDKAVTVATIPQNQKMIILDAGHGGIDGGCSTPEGKTEKVINLNIVLTLKDMCTFFGYPVEATRERDISIYDKGVTGIRNQKNSDMDNRLEIFNKYPDAVCISIHQNTFSDPKYNGAQMFYSENIPESEQLASIMQNLFVKNLQPENQRETKLCGKELFLCYYSTNPTVMIECGFLSNPDDAAKLTTESFQQQVAFTVFTGLNEFIEG